MKRCLMYLAVVLLLGSTAFGLVDRSLVRSDTIQPARRLQDTLQSIIDQINDELGEVRVRGTGNIYYVDSAVGSDSYDGTKPEWATATLDAAVALCTADNGDVICVMPGHNEAVGTAADDVDLDVAGITVIGLGYGLSRPTFDYDSDVTGTFAIGADSVVIANLNFLPSVTDINEAIELEAAGDNAVIFNCWFMDGESSGTDEFKNGCIRPSAAGANYLTIANCQFDSYGAAAVTAIDLTVGAETGTQIFGNKIYGNWSTAAIYSDDADLNQLIVNNDITQLTASAFCISFTGAATGICRDNICNPATSGWTTDAGSMQEGPAELGEHVVSKVATGASDDLWDVDGGPIEVLSVWGVVSTAVDANAATIRLFFDGDTGYADHYLSDTVTFNDLALGTFISFEPNSTSPYLPIAATAAANTTNGSQPVNWFCGQGMIEQVCSASNSTGAVTWYMRYRPLTKGVVVNQK